MGQRVVGRTAGARICAIGSHFLGQKMDPSCKSEERVGRSMKRRTTSWSVDGYGAANGENRTGLPAKLRASKGFLMVHTTSTTGEEQESCQKSADTRKVEKLGMETQSEVKNQNDVTSPTKTDSKTASETLNHVPDLPESLFLNSASKLLSMHSSALTNKSPEQKQEGNKLDDAAISTTTHLRGMHDSHKSDRFPKSQASKNKTLSQTTLPTKDSASKIPA